MVLEPWITPSLFYQFLGKGEGEVGMDSYSFCEVLGGKEANRQLKNHWETWVTEDLIVELKDSGAVNSLRLPIGDYQFIPYGPYLNGCWDGGLGKLFCLVWFRSLSLSILCPFSLTHSHRLHSCLPPSYYLSTIPFHHPLHHPLHYTILYYTILLILDYVDKVLDWAYENGMSVLLDVHAMKDSQNGFDNSGQQLGFEYTTAIKYEFSPQITFAHWPLRSAEWMGKFDYETASYPKINKSNIEHSLEVIQLIIDRYKHHPAVMGIEPVNEPWEHTPIEELKSFYWEGYLKVKRDAPYWRFVMHDSFRPDPKIWGGYMDGCPDRAIDMHIYQAWRDPDSRLGYYRDACAQKRTIAAMERDFGPIIVGEWSLATDNWYVL
jgi:aryl-phospho-beta-D-glucosidase BglC (GH1 family)